jgi:adenosylcobalamin-dependent ribonucleoside-triphosphate reductase
MEVFTNCSTAATSFALFYLLLNGSGVGRSYDDELVAVDWAEAPDILLYLSPEHADSPHTPAEEVLFAAELELPCKDLEEARSSLSEELLASLSDVPVGATVFRVPDSREGWAQAVELLEAAAFRGARGETIVFDLSDVRRKGAPIHGMQNRPASGPVSMLRALSSVHRLVIGPARTGSLALWEQAMVVDHVLSVEVQVGGARRAARMATKSWRDPGIFRFIRCKSEAGLWTANNSVMVDAEFWRRVHEGAGGDAEDSLSAHAAAVFQEATRCAYTNGEPGFINGDRLEDHRTGTAWEKPVYEDGRDFCSTRYQAGPGKVLLAEMSRRASSAVFPMITNPCSEICLHVTGGVCVIADFAPLLACPADPTAFAAGLFPAELEREWDARVEESVRLGVRFLIRVNTMNALYGEEIRRTNRIGIGPTGVHEWAWARFGFEFWDLLDEKRSKPFWDMLDHLSVAAKEEADLYSDELGVKHPVTVTTSKPAGTTSKLFGLTEGAHLPARRQYIRWVTFQGTRPEGGPWEKGSDPLLADYESRGYPVRVLKSFRRMSIVGFPTVPLIQRLGLNGQLVTATEVDPASHYAWLRLLERHWIGAERGNQVSYTLKVNTEECDLEAFQALLLRHQPGVRCCALLPSVPDSKLGYEYLPEEEVTKERFAQIVDGIHDPALHEMVNTVHLQCPGGVCPI